MSSRKITKKKAIEIADKIVSEDVQKIREMLKDDLDPPTLYRMQLVRVIEHKDIWIIEYEPVKIQQMTMEGGHMTVRIDKVSGAIVS